MLHVGAVFYQLAAEFMCNFKRFLNRAVYTRIGRCVKRDIQFQLNLMLFCIFAAFRQMLIRGIVLDVYQCDMQNIQANINGNIY